MNSAVFDNISLIAYKCNILGDFFIYSSVDIIEIDLRVKISF